MLESAGSFYIEPVIVGALKKRPVQKGESEMGKILGTAALFAALVLMGCATTKYAVSPAGDQPGCINQVCAPPVVFPSMLVSAEGETELDVSRLNC